MSYLELRQQWQWLGIFIVSVLLLIGMTLHEYRFWTDPDHFALPSSNVAPILKEKMNSAELLDDTQKWHLFGANPNQDGQVAAPPVQLIGLFMSPDPKLRSAVLQETSGSETLVKIGSMVSSQWKVLDIQKDFLILVNEGQRVRIDFRRPSLNDGESSVATANRYEDDSIDVLPKIRRGR